MEVEAENFEKFVIHANDINSAVVNLVKEKMSVIQGSQYLDIHADVQDVLLLRRIARTSELLFTGMALNDWSGLKMNWLGLTKADGPSHFFIMDFASNGRQFLYFIMQVRY